MKKNKTLLLLLGIFLILMTVFLLLNHWNKTKQETAAITAEEPQIQVTEIDGLSALSYEGRAGSMAFEYKDGVWYYSEDKEIPIIQSKIQNIADSYCRITATRLIDQPDAPGDYGLEPPNDTVYLTGTDGNTYTVKLGNLADSERYLMLNDQETDIYTVNTSLSTVLMYSLDTLVEKDSLPSIGSANLSGVSILSEGGMKSYSSENEDSSEILATISGGYGAMSLTECASFHLTDSERQEFKLEESSRTTVTLTYQDSNDEEQTYTIYIGGLDSTEEQRYVQVDNSQIVYLVSADIIANLLGSTFS